MIKYILFCLLSGLACEEAIQAQDLAAFHLYHPEEDAAAGIQNALIQAKATHKNLFVQIGGNWCIWCARFYELSTGDPQIDSAFKANYIVYHLNYSKENENLPIMARLGHPERFGFPVFVILNTEGTLVHIQNSSYLEQGKGYNKGQIISFLNDWSPRALDPATYK
jgi:thiol:disulfide interchange protein